LNSSRSASMISEPSRDRLTRGSSCDSF
jgi:hypothetical protein